MMRHKWAIILVLLLLAFGLRLYHLTSVPLSLDEIVTIRRYARLPVTEIFQTYHSNNHPLISALAHIFSPQADNLFMLRWPSILVGLIALPFIYRLGASLFDRRVGLLALFFVSLTPVYIGYSVIMRGYGGLISFTAIALYFLGQALRRNRWRDWLGLAASAMMVAFFHLFSLLALGLALGLVGVWLLWQFSQQTQRAAGLPPIRIIWPKFVTVTVILMTIYGLIIFSRVTSVLDEGGYSGEFEIWRDGFSQWDDLKPLTLLIGFMAPMSAGGWAAYVFLAFAVTGLVVVWRRQPVLGLAVMFWLLAPLGIIFVAMRLLGTGFYAYVRFLLYMLPVFLSLAAVGMVSVNDALSAWGCRRERSRQIAVRVLQGGVLAGLLVLQLNSLHWYLERATHADWWGLAQALSAELSPQDMLVCEEYQRGFDLPDRAKPYCTWMLGFFLKREEYTSLFPSSTDFVTGYDHLQAERESLLKPGRVWLVIWQKIPFNVEHLITTEAPVMAPPPPPDTLVPYFTRPYGSAILVRVDSEPTLLGNLYRAVEVLLKADPAPVAQARYYRSLAEMTALQGQVGRARELLAKSQTLVSQNGGSVDSFLAHTQQVIDRIPADSSPPPTAYPVGYKFGSALCLLAYEVLPLTPTAGQPLNLNFYWRALEPVKQDYNFFLDLEANQRNRLEFEPFDRTFPTPWWWSGQQVVENRSFNLPLDLPGQDYTVNFGVHDRQGQAVEEVAPLFKMQYQPDDGGLSRWKIKSITGPAVCP